MSPRRIAVVCTEEAGGRERLALARADGGAEVGLIAPPEIAAALGEEGRWAPADAELAMPDEAFRASVEARAALVDWLRPGRAARTGRPGSEESAEAAIEVRFGDSGAAWAACLDARSGGALGTARISIELAERDGLLGEAPGIESLPERIFRLARLAALRDADQIAGDAAVKARLASRGVSMASSGEGAAPAWPSGQTPLVSVVIPHKDHGAYLPACLESLRRQEARLEIIVVDDGSGAESLAVLEGLERAEPSLRVIRQANAGPGAARNRGVQEASGELVLFVDADDLVRPGLVVRLAEALRLLPRASAATCAFRRFDGATGATVDHYCPVELDAASLFIENVGGDVCALHRREALLRAGGFGTRFHWLPEDWNLWLRYAGLGQTTCVVPEVLFDYRVLPGSRSGSSRHRRVTALFAQEHAGLLREHALEVYAMQDIPRRETQGAVPELVRRVREMAAERQADLDKLHGEIGGLRAEIARQQGLREQEVGGLRAEVLRQHELRERERAAAVEQLQAAERRAQEIAAQRQADLDKLHGEIDGLRAEILRQHTLRESEGAASAARLQEAEQRAQAISAQRQADLDKLHGEIHGLRAEILRQHALRGEESARAAAAVQALGSELARLRR